MQLTNDEKQTLNEKRGETSLAKNHFTLLSLKNNVYIFQSFDAMVLKAKSEKCLFDLWNLKNAGEIEMNLKV